MNSTIFMLLTLQFTLMVYEEYRAPKRREEAKPCISQDYFINVLLLPQPTKKFDSPELKKNIFRSLILFLLPHSPSLYLLGSLSFLLSFLVFITSGKEEPRCLHR